MELNKERDRFCIKNIFDRKYRYIHLLIYWPILGIIFEILESHLTARLIVEMEIDKLIPFCSWFCIPYLFWFVYVIGTIALFFFFDKESLVKYMWYVIFTYSFTIFVYVLFPNCQNLRPELATVLQKNSWDYKIMEYIYSSDTNTNVCPSLHVIGSFAVYFSIRNSKIIKSKVIKWIYLILAIIISLSTLFVKQHSLFDVICGMVVAVLAYPFVFSNNKFSKKLLQL